MRLTLAILIALLVCTTAWARVDKLPASHDENVARVEAARNAPPSDPPWDGRPGTIKHALEQPDGTLDSLAQGQSSQRGQETVESKLK